MYMLYQHKTQLAVHFPSINFYLLNTINRMETQNRNGHRRIIRNGMLKCSALALLLDRCVDMPADDGLSSV